MKALVIVDMQNGIFDKHIKVFNEGILINNINQLLDYFHDANWPVVFVRFTGCNILKENSQAWEIIDKLHLKNEDLIINKQGSDAFEVESFTDFLQSHCISEIVVTGVFSHGCVQSTVVGGYRRGYEMFLAKDAHSNIAIQAPRIIASVNQRLKTMGISVVSCAELMS
jgi:nicotinamidase-related amidase